MGEVYRARDTRLDRSVAIKILSRVSPMMRERFEREARTISSLSHPHICALFDVGQHDGVDYLVMEYLEGESLADRLSRGPLAAEQVLRYGVEIADALYAAHRMGVVHRDLKPGNIIITKSGAKLLDFGLAKTISDEAVGGSTVQKPLTEEGTLLGTVQYMSPEQLEGREADARTDIFALGAVLYEMATGKRAFEGKSRASLIASILDREPTPISQLQPLTPPALERVVRVCMAKDPDDRWQSAHDIAAELRWIAEGTSSASGGRASQRTIPRRFAWALGGLIAGLVIGAFAIWLATRDHGAPQPVARFSVALPPDAPFGYGNLVGLALSPDGTRFAYRAVHGTTARQLYVRALGQVRAIPIVGTEDATIPAFSPDGRSIAYCTERDLYKVALDGSLPVKLAPLPHSSTLGIVWRGKNVYYVPFFTGGIWSVPASGGTQRQIAKVDPKNGVRALLWPDVLPDEKHVIATAWNGGSWDDAKIVAYPLNGGDSKVIIDGGTCPRYIPTGHLLYERSGNLYAVRFDPETLRVTGDAVPVVNGIASGVLNGEAHYAVSNNGTLLYAAGGVLEDKRKLLWIDRSGSETPVVPTERPYSDPALSPDGRTIAVTLETATFDVWQLDTERDTLTRVSYGGDDSRPLWTPDGKRLVWTSSRPGVNNLFWAAADGSSSEQRLTVSRDAEFDSAISPDGRYVAATQRRGAKTDVVMVPLAGDHKEQPYLSGPFNDEELSFSPDGKWVAYISDSSGRKQAYLRPFDSAGGTWQISIDGATECKWAHNGREVTYVNGDALYVVPVETTPRVRIGKPQLLFRKPVSASPFTVWDLSPDDQKILWVKPQSPPTTNELQIVLNWFDEMNWRAPSR